MYEDRKGKVREERLDSWLWWLTKSHKMIGGVRLWGLKVSEPSPREEETNEMTGMWRRTADTEFWCEGRTRTRVVKPRARWEPPMGGTGTQVREGKQGRIGIQGKEGTQGDKQIQKISNEGEKAGSSHQHRPKPKPLRTARTRSRVERLQVNNTKIWRSREARSKSRQARFRVPMEPRGVSQDVYEDTPCNQSGGDMDLADHDSVSRFVESIEQLEDAIPIQPWPAEPGVHLKKAAHLCEELASARPLQCPSLYEGLTRFRHDLELNPNPDEDTLLDRRTNINNKGHTIMGKGTTTNNTHNDGNDANNDNTTPTRHNDGTDANNDHTTPTVDDQNDGIDANNDKTTITDDNHNDIDNDTTTNTQPYPPNKNKIRKQVSTVKGRREQPNVRTKLSTIAKFRETLGRNEGMRRVWDRYAREKGYMAWDEVGRMALLEFVCVCKQLVRELRDKLGPREGGAQGKDSFWSIGKGWLEAWENIMHVDTVKGLTPMDAYGGKGEGIGLASDTAFGLEHKTPLEGTKTAARVWLVQPDEKINNLLTLLQDPSKTGCHALVLGIPQVREDWVSLAEDLCKDPNKGWVAFRGKKGMGLPLQRWVKREKRKKFKHSKNINIPHAFPVSWYVIAPDQERPIILNIHKYIACLSSLSKGGKGVWHMPPASHSHTMGKTSEKETFCDLWAQLREERRELCLGTMDKERLAANLANTRAILHLSPHSWIRKVVGLSKAWNTPYNIEGVFIYVVINMQDGRVYVGQAGEKTKRGKRKLVDRWYEHVQGAKERIRGKTFRKGKGNREEGENLYKAMAEGDIGDWVMLPLEVVQGKQADAREMDWMTQFGEALLNVRKPRSYARNKKWLGLGKVNLEEGAEKKTTKEWIKEGWGLLNCRKGKISLSRLFVVWLQGKTKLGNELFTRLGSLLRSTTKYVLKITLPANIAIPYPVSNGVCLRDMRDMLKGIIGGLPVPPLIRKYIGAITNFVGKKSAVVRDLLCTKGTSLPWDKMVELSQENCSCHRAPPSVPRVQGCVVARKFEDWRLLVPKQTPFLAQNMGNGVVGGWDYYKTEIEKASARLTQVLPLLQGTLKKEILTNLLDEGHNIYMGGRDNTPKTMLTEEVQLARKALNRKWAVIPADKNVGKCFLVCRTFYFRLLVATYTDKNQFLEVSTEATQKKARSVAMTLLKKSLDAVNLGHRFSTGKGKKPPNSFLFIKNKSNESSGTIKTRVLFSFFSDPCKEYSRRVGRCLSLLIKVGRSYMQTLEMTNMVEVKDWVDGVNAHLAEREKTTPLGKGGEKKLHIWELDVKEMFPRLKRGNPKVKTYEQIKDGTEGGVWEAVLKMVAVVQQEKGVRKGKGGPWFAIHKTNNKLDEMRRAYHEDFENFSWEEIRPFIHWEIFNHDIFTVGSRIMRQTRGMPIGGVMSAQLASIFCMVREHEYFTGFPLFAHNPYNNTQWDPKPEALKCAHLGVGIRPYRFRDNVVGMRVGTGGLARIGRWATKVLGLELQVEGMGKEWVSLEATLKVEGTRVRLGMKKKQNWSDPPEKRLIRYPDLLSPTCQTTLRSLTPGLARKALLYADSPVTVLDNINYIIREFCFKGYPHQWWKPLLYRTLKTLAPTIIRELSRHQKI
jgi:hypothetical protein